MHTNRIRWTVGLLISCLLGAHVALSAGLEARLDRTRISESETVTLLLRDDGSHGGAPDLGPLQRDFDVLSQGRSTRVQVHNGRTESWHEWQLLLAPKRTGKLTIPALRLGGAVSQPLDLEVVAAAQAAAGDAPGPVMLEVEVSDPQPYVQGKVIYTVRVLTQVHLRQPQLSDPGGDELLMERLGQDRRYETSRNGQRYRVVERRYAIFPQRSGQLRIAAPILTAQVREARKQQRPQRDRLFEGRDPFADIDRLFGSSPFDDMDGLFGRTRTLRMRGNEITLEVQPQPPGTPTPWLPAESVALNETWSPDPPRFRVGEPVTRSIAITALGVSAAQLPDLATPGVAGIQQYPDKPRLQTCVDGDTLVAQKITGAALVPSRAGEYTLPAVELHWWDTQQNRARTTRLPERTIEVEPAAAGAAAPAPPPLPQPAPSTLPEPSPGDAGHGGQSAAPGADRADSQSTGFWPWLTAAFALAWLITAALWWQARRVRREPPGAPHPTSPADDRPGPSAALRALQQACENNDARAARQTLLAWAASRWPRQAPRTLEELAPHLPAASAVLRDLDRHLYAAGSDLWNGAAAWQQLQPVLAKVRPPEAKPQGDGALPPLYPGQD